MFLNDLYVAVGIWLVPDTKNEAFRYPFPHKCGKTFFRFFYLKNLIFFDLPKHIFIINVVKAIIRVGKAINLLQK